MLGSFSGAGQSKILLDSLYNIVPNNSFELLDNHPLGWFYNGKQFNRVMKYWYSPTAASPDVYCPKVKVPNSWQNNGFSKENPYEGTNMVGITMYGCQNGKPHCREYIEIQLIEPLVTGQKYYFEFFIKQLPNSLAINNIGFGFSYQSDINLIRKSLEDAVHRQLMSDVPYGVLLSGGLDSSIISAVAKKYAAKRIESGDTSEAWYPQLHSFAVGLEGSPDLKAARIVADHIGSIHHEVHFTIQEGLDAIRDVIYHLETYDITTIRASTPMYLMARVIKSMGIKMVLSGEGSDEIFGGYLYFHKAPNAEEFHKETVRKLDKLHLYDCNRANKALAAWGVEGRVPFLDKEFMDVAMRLNPSDKMVAPGKIEKWILRKAFEDLLPASVAWRQKEQFSDGVGYNWIDSLKALVNEQVSDDQLANAKYRFPVQTPSTKEEYHYRSIFQELFPSDAAALCVPSVPSVACSSPVALAWDIAFQNMNEPSGRAILTVHQDAYEESLAEN